MEESQILGFKHMMDAQIELGSKIRATLEKHGFKSVAEKGFQAPGVVVSYTTDAEIQSSRKFLAEGLQTAAGVPLQCDEGADFKAAPARRLLRPVYAHDDGGDQHQPGRAPGGPPVALQRHLPRSSRWAHAGWSRGGAGCL